jgi:phage shock protein E
MQNNLPTTWVALTLLVILALWLISPALAGSGDPVQAKQAWSMIDNGALLIDVRTKEEFAAGHLEGALNISWEDTNALANAIGEDPGRPVVVYCRSGNRSGKAGKALAKQGYNHIFNGTGLEALKATKP